MKVAILVDILSPGATPRFTSEEVRWLTKMGHDVELVSIMDTGMPEGSYQFQEILKGVPIRYLSREFSLLKAFDFRIPPFSFLSGHNIAGIFLVPWIIKENEYDVVIAHASTTCYIAYRLWRKRKIPYVAYMWDSMSFMLDYVYKQRLPNSIFRVLSKLCYKLDNTIINNSLATVTGSRPHLKEIQKVTDKPIQVIYPGCYPLEHIPDKRGDYILTVDRWDVGNMPTMLIDMLERIKVKAKLLVAGFWWPEELKYSFIDHMVEKGLQDQVEILGPVTDDKLKELYSNARLLAFPLQGGINFCVLEAASHGCPVVMPEGIDLFTHGLNGFFPENGNIDEYAKYVEQLISDERLAWEMGNSAWELTQTLSWERHAKELDRIIFSQS